jgi:hypothetical protein
LDDYHGDYCRWKRDVERIEDRGVDRCRDVVERWTYTGLEVRGLLLRPRS